MNDRIMFRTGMIGAIVAAVCCGVLRDADCANWVGRLGVERLERQR